MATYDLTTVQNVKDAIELPTNVTKLDTLIPELITQASSTILEHCQREFLPQTNNATRRFMVDDYRVNLAPYDLRSVTSVVLNPESSSGGTTLTDGTNGTQAQYMLRPINPVRGVYQSIQFSGYLVIISQTLMQFGYAFVDITGNWGWPSVPDRVVRATNITVGAWLTRMGIGGSTGWGIPDATGGGAISFRNDWHLPWAACKLLSPYVRSTKKFV